MRTVKIVAKSIALKFREKSEMNFTNKKKYTERDTHTNKIYVFINYTVRNYLFLFDKKRINVVNLKGP